MKLSVVNRIREATITAGSQASGYPVTNVITPEKPIEAPYKSAAAGSGQHVTMHYATPFPLDVFAITRANLVTVTFQADDAPTFDSGAAGAPQYSAALTLAPALYTGRYTYAHCPPTPITRANHRLLIADQTPVAASPFPAGVGFYLFGGFWAGPLAALPHNILANPTLRRNEPKAKQSPGHGGWTQVSSMGEPWITLEARRYVQQDAAELDTELRAWAAIDALWDVGDVALVMPHDNVPTDAYIMRRDQPEWDYDPLYPKGPLVMTEVIG